MYSVCLSGDHFEDDSSLIVISATSTSDLSNRCTSVVGLYTTDLLRFLLLISVWAYEKRLGIWDTERYYKCASVAARFK